MDNYKLNFKSFIMKKIFFCLLFSGLILTGLSQNSTESMLNELGVIIAPGYSMILGGESWSGTFGFQIGAETQVYKCNENSSIYAGILVSIQGASYEETHSSLNPFGLKSALFEDSYKGKVSLGYISIPILFNYKLDQGLYLEGGIQPGLLVSAKDTPEGAEGYDYKDYIKAFDIGIPVGAGFWFNDRVSIGARVVYGLPNINTEGTDMYSSEDNDHNLLILGVARIKFNKK